MNIEKINYRLLNKLDKNLYRKIRLDCLENFPENFGTTYKEELNKKSLKFDEALDQVDPPNFIFGAFHDSNLIGICGFFQQQRLKTKHQGDISQMYIDPHFSRQGIGTKLLKLTVNKEFEIKTIDQILLGVMNNNDRAISAYKKIGFTQCGLIENYFKKDGKCWSQLFMILTKENYESH